MSPDEQYGYGIPDLFKAYGLLQVARGINTISNAGNQWISAFPVPYTDDFTVVFRSQNNGNASLSLIDILGRAVERKMVSTGMGQWYSVRFDRSSLLPAGVYLIRYTDGKLNTTLRVVRR
jgi:hypothetical protein